MTTQKKKLSAKGPYIRLAPEPLNIQDVLDEMEKQRETLDRILTRLDRLTSLVEEIAEDCD